MLLLDEGVPSTLRRTAGFDVPDMLAAGPRDVLVPESGVEVARQVLLQSELESPATAPAAQHRRAALAGGAAARECLLRARSRGAPARACDVATSRRRRLGQVADRRAPGSGVRGARGAARKRCARSSARPLERRPRAHRA